MNPDATFLIIRIHGIYNILQRNDAAERISTLASQRKAFLFTANFECTDASYCNLVFEDFAGQLFTPSDALLPGTCRQRLIDNGTVIERPIPVNDLQNYKTAYFINAMMDLEEAQQLPITAIQ